MTRFSERSLQSEFRIDGEDLERILTPALVVYLDKVRENLRRLVALAGDVDRLRPHIKTAKLPRVFREIVRTGIRRFKCATTREARHLLQVLDEESVEAGDLLVAYPHVGPGLSRLARLAEAHRQTRLSVLCEDPSAVSEIPSTLGIYVDLNSGMNRTGRPTGEQAAIFEIAARAGSRFRGLHHYEGHISGGPAEDRRNRCFRLYDELVRLVSELERAGHRVGEVVTSGTPSFRHALAHDGLRDLGGPRHRVSPGTVVYSDARTEELTELDFVPAALLLSRVISHPGPGLITCDAGSKSIAAEAGDPVALALGWPHLVARALSEEHLVFSVTSGEVPARGEALLLFPRHICPTVNLAEAAVVMEEGRVREVVPVSARGHDLRAEPAG